MSAVLDGDHFVVNGQKMWNTFGQPGELVRAARAHRPDVPQHNGISCLLVDMTLPGIEVRPLSRSPANGSSTRSSSTTCGCR